MNRLHFDAVLAACVSGGDQPSLIGPGLELVYAASWFMVNSFSGTMISGAGGRYPSALACRHERSRMS